MTESLTGSNRAPSEGVLRSTGRMCQPEIVSDSEEYNNMALLPKNHLKTLTAVGSIQQGKFVCDSTSFHVGFIAKDAPKPEDRLYHMFLVTNRHVFEGRDSATFRVNTDDGKNKTFATPLKDGKGENRWLAHPDKDVDIALLSVNPDSMRKNGIEPVFIVEELFAYRKKFEEIGVAAGDDLYILGFPMGIAGEEQNHACVKAGIISRIDDEIIKSRRAVIIDSSIFPGNSGGPAIMRPTLTSIDGTKAVTKPYLLGVVSGYLPYIDNLFTHQTHPPTVVSTTRENSGLSFCVPIDFAKEIYTKWLEKQKPIEPPQKNIDAETVDETVKTSNS